MQKIQQNRALPVLQFVHLFPLLIVLEQALIVQVLAAFVVFAVLIDHVIVVFRVMYYFAFYCRHFQHQSFFICCQKINKVINNLCNNV